MEVTRNDSNQFTGNNRLPSRPLIELNPLVVSLDRGAFLSRLSFFRVAHSSSSSSTGWLIKYDAVGLRYGTFNLINPLSRIPLHLRPRKSFNLSRFKVSEIQQAYMVENRSVEKETVGFRRLVLNGDQQIIGVGCDWKLRYWNGEMWTRVKDQVAQFCDVIVDSKGLTYALDSKGIVWWISSSLDIFRYGPLLDEDITIRCLNVRSLVECCEEFYIVDRIFKNSGTVRSFYGTSDPNKISAIYDDVGISRRGLSERRFCPKTFGFKVYKVDEESLKWVEVKSLGDNAIVIATDTCFSVLAHEFRGCLKNSIYFSEEDYHEDEIKVFKLEDGSITTTRWLACTYVRV